MNHNQAGAPIYEQQRADQTLDGSGDDTALRRPDEAIKDLEPDKEEGEAVTGGAFDAYLQFNPVKGESGGG
jgi:hypothetical protein